MNIFKKNPPMPCPQCAGAKRVTVTRFTTGKPRVIGKTCPMCRGRGTLPRR